MEESTVVPDLDDAAVIFVENEPKCVSVRGEAVRMHPRSSNVLDTCPVCHRHFHNREPKLLPCLHSFCVTCLPPPSRNLAMPEPTASSQFDRSTKPLNVIRCPVCRQECMEVDVMENFFVKDSGEIPSAVQRTVQLCLSCEDNTEASGFCVDCVEFLCATCVEAHQRVKFTRDHTIRQKEEVAEESRGASNQRPAFCDVHKQEPLKLFCETCDLLTCRDCQLLKHKDHNYQFLEDAYKNLKRHMERVTQQLQEKKKVVDDMSSSIDQGLSQVDENRTLVHNEIKKSICGLILEINRKGKILVNQLEALTKDSETVLKKQKEDIGYLSRHLDHVINFSQWATARNSSTALLHCKRLILFQIGNLLRAKCSTSFAPQSTLRFQCRSGFWASNVDLGSLVLENLPSHSMGGSYQGLHQQLPHPRQGPQGSPGGPPSGPPQAHPAPHSTLAQLQQQVEKLSQQPTWQPPPPPWTWYQSLGLQKPGQGPLRVGSPSQTGLPVNQLGRRFMALPSNHLSPTGSLPSPVFAPQAVLPLRGMGSSSGFPPPEPFQASPLHSHSAPLLSSNSFSSSHSHLQTEPLYLSQRADGVGTVQIRRPSFSQTLPPFLPHRNGSYSHHAEGVQSSQGLPAVSREEKPGTVSWRPTETQGRSAPTSAAKRRRRSSPGPVIIIKDEPEEDLSYMQGNQKSNLPDSTGVQAPPNQGGGQTLPNPSPDDQAKTPPQPPEVGGDPAQVDGPQETAGTPASAPAPETDPDRERCAVCQTDGKLLTCDKCSKSFHLACHIPTLPRYPSVAWLCTLCRESSLPDMEDGCVRSSLPDMEDGCVRSSLPDMEDGCVRSSLPDMEDGCVRRPELVKEETLPEPRLSPENRRKCERLLLWLYCSQLGAGFKETRSPLVMPEDTGDVRACMNLAAVKNRLESTSIQEYHSPAELISDIRLLFRKPAAPQEPGSVTTAAVRKLELLFEEQLKVEFPDRTFPEVKTEVTGPVTPPVSPPSSPGLTLPPGAPQQVPGAPHPAPGAPQQVS